MNDGQIRVIAAGIILNEAQNKVLLIRRGDSMWGDSWSIPGGHVDFGEKVVDTVIRELHEELELKIMSTKFLHYEEFFHPSKSNIEFISFNFVVIANEEVKPNYEVKEARWFSFDELQHINHKLPGPALNYIDNLK